VSEEILINVTPRETRVARIEGGMLQEVHVERARRRGYAGNIYKGRVRRVMPGMQADFVDIGLARRRFARLGYRQAAAGKWERWRDGRTRIGAGALDQ
jgi:Ribonuclease G/E